MKQLRVPLEDDTDAALTEVARRERTTREDLVRRLIRARVHADEGDASGPNAAATKPQAEPDRPTMQHIARASIDRRLELTARRGQLQATIREHNIGPVVVCSFTEEAVGRIGALIGKRVIAEGFVRYDKDGTPTSIEDVTAIAEHTAGRPLEDFVGATPTLTGGLTPEELLARVYGDE